jgi:hypothetical protein
MSRTSIISAAFATSRPGTSVSIPAVEPDSVARGLELSDVLYKPREWFRANPENEIFRALKTDAYLRDLERDIRETGQIINPLIALNDGLLLEGESRLIVAGRIGMYRLPVRIVLSPITEDEQRKRLWLGNLSRFEVDQDTRIFLYARIWPGYFREDSTLPSLRREGIAESVGVSERHVKRMKTIIKAADELAKAEGRETTPEDVRAAREEKAKERREAGAKPEDARIIRVRQVGEELRVKEGESLGEVRDAYRVAADRIEEALR